MKIRIKDNSVRLRLTQAEVKQLSEIGEVRSMITFGVEIKDTLVYAVVSTISHTIDVTYKNHTIEVKIPASMINQWANSEQVSIRHEKPISPGESLIILVEKDFKCLTERPDENEEDMFPHPDTTQHTC